MYAAKCNNGKVEMYPCHGVNAFYYSVHCNAIKTGEPGLQ